METFGDRLKKALLEKKLSQIEFATLINKEGKTVINNWVNNRAKPSADDLAKISQILHVSIDWLMLGKNNLNYKIKEDNNNFMVEEPQENYAGQKSQTVTIPINDYLEFMQFKNKQLQHENESLKRATPSIHSNKI